MAKIAQLMQERLFQFRFISALKRAFSGDMRPLQRLRPPEKYEPVVLACLGNAHLWHKDRAAAHSYYTSAIASELGGIAAGRFVREGTRSSQYILAYCDLMICEINAVEGDPVSKAELSEKRSHAASIAPTGGLLRHCLPMY